MADISNTSAFKYKLINFGLRYVSAIRTFLCLLFILLAWYTAKQETEATSIVFYILAYISGGYEKAWEGLKTLVKERDLDVDLLMVVAAIGAAWIGHWMDGAILIFIFSLSGTLEEYTMEKTNRDIKHLLDLKPSMTVVLENGNERLTKVSEVVIGDIIRVKPSEKIAADGIIEQGESAINQAPITGESIPVDKGKGDEVFSGTINGQGAIDILVTKSVEETTLAKLIQLVQEAKEEKPPVQLFVERFEGIYAKIVVIIALLLLMLPPYFLNWSWEETVYRAMIFLVVASPCALVSSIMPAILSAISNAARKGVLFKGGIHLQNLAETKVVAFDKTGTLTTGKLRVTDFVSLVQKYSDLDLLRITASIELLSEHPVAKAIVSYAIEQKLELKSPVYLSAMHGAGVYAELNGLNYSVGKHNHTDSNKTILPDSQKNSVDQLEKEGKTVIFIVENELLIGFIALQDTIRRTAQQVVRDLKIENFKIVMLTGDSEATANKIAQEVGIKEVYANLLPQDKVSIIKQLATNDGQVVMVGDGVNDAPALATASVGIAVGSGKDNVAMETADVVLLSGGIDQVPYAISLAQRSKRIIRQNITFAITVVILLVVLNFIGGIINLPEGVVGHEGSTILVILNGLRLLI